MRTAEMPKILLVDDDQIILRTLSLELKSSYALKTAATVPTAKAILQNNPIDLVVADLNFEGQTDDGLVLMDWIAKQMPEIPIVVYSLDKKIQRIIAATRRNPINVIVKLETDTDADLKSAIKTGLIQRKLNLAQKAMGFQFLTESPTMQKILDDVNKVAARGLSPSILITGESGTGKEILAKHIAARFQKRIISANMAAIPKDMAESELFGHSRGAFTGAYADKIGLIEQSHGGIFFLDELGDCPPPLQAKLLRVVQEGEIRRLGDRKEKKVSVQFLSATNKDLPAMIRAGEFREDLYQRLNTFTLHIPPLRKRPEDVQVYITSFIQEFARGESFPIRACGIAGLLEYSWPGNVRELYHFAQRVVSLADIRELNDSVIAALLGKRDIVEPQTDSECRTALMKALEQTGGNRTHAARILGIDPSTIYRKMRRLGINY